MRGQERSLSQNEASSITLPCFSFLLQQWDQKIHCCCFTECFLTVTAGGFSVQHRVVGLILQGGKAEALGFSVGCKLLTRKNGMR